jgi:hypothetical protein
MSKIQLYHPKSYKDKHGSEIKSLDYKVEHLTRLVDSILRKLDNYKSH